jgi:hypothetical protein
MNVQTVPAASGIQWVIGGFKLLMKQPLPLLALTFLYLMCLGIPAIIPVIGGWMPFVIAPILTVGLMRASELVDKGESVPTGTLFEGLKNVSVRANHKRLPSLLALGAFNLVATLIVLTVTMLFDGGLMMQIATGTVESNNPLLKTNAIVTGALTFLILYTPIQMALWFAPMFVAWHDVAPVKSLFFSLIAVWRNRGAFLVYGLTLFAVAVLVSILIQVLRSVIGSSGMLAMVLWPISLIMLAVVFASFWISYKQTIHSDDTPDVLETTTE